MIPKEKARQIFIKFMYLKNKERTEYISTKEIALESSLIAVELLKEQVTSTSFYDRYYWDEVKEEIKLLEPVTA